MRRLARAALVLTVVGIVAGHAPGAWACSCAYAGDEQQFAGARAVFIGTATASEDPNEGAEFQSSGDPIRWTFDVESVQKGRVTDPAKVTTERDGATCGFSFVVGERYQVFAYRSDGELRTNICTGTRALAQEAAYRPAGAAGTIVAGGSEEALPVTGTRGPAAAGLVLLGTAGLIAARAARARPRRSPN